MIKIIGPDWPSKRQLQEALMDVRGELTVCWGTEGQGLGGQPRVNGFDQLDRMAYEGVLAPKVTRDKQVARKWIEDGKVVWGRNNEHTKGLDIVDSTSRKFWEKDFWVQVIPNIEREWRIHVFRGRVIARGLKHQVEPEKAKRLAIRNRRTGWRIRHDVESNDALREVAKKAVKTLGYDFGAVDLAIDNKGKIWVLEVNRAPGLDDYTLGQYVKAIKREVE